jgi:hypothetical protein
VGLTASERYIADCASIVFPQPRRTRTSVEWTDELRAQVDATIAEHSFLTGYTFDS